MDYLLVGFACVMVGALLFSFVGAVLMDKAGLVPRSPRDKR